MSVTASFSREKKGFVLSHSSREILKHGSAWSTMVRLGGPVGGLIWHNNSSSSVRTIQLWCCIVPSCGCAPPPPSSPPPPLLATSSWDIYKSSKAYKLETMLVSCPPQMSLLKLIYKPHYDHQNFSPLANGTDLNRQKYAILQTHWH